MLTATDGSGTRFRVSLHPLTRHPGTFLALLPARVSSLALQLADGSGTAAVETLRVRECGDLEMLARVTPAILRRLRASPSSAPRLARSATDMLQHDGFQTAVARLLDMSPPTPSGQSYEDWIAAFDTLSEADCQQIRHRISRFRVKPLMSIVMPVFDPPEEFLRQALDSVLAQLYERWELCIADDASPGTTARRVLTEYAERDSRIKVVYRKSNGGIAAASNSALELASGDFMVLVDQDDTLPAHALYMVAEELEARPNSDLIYSDEDKIDARGHRSDPYFKPDWSPDLLYSQNYINHLGVYRLELVRRLGGFREKFEGSQDYDLVLRVSRQTSRDRIRHIPHVLYHWRSLPTSVASSQSAKTYALDAARRSINEHLEALGARAEVGASRLPHYHRVTYALPKAPPLASIIVPTRDRADLLAPCAKGVLERTDYPSFELVILDNQSSDPDTLELFNRLERDPRVRVLRYDHPFNYAAINNWGVEQARGEIITLLNNDTEVISRDWLREMVSHACRPGVGMVGAKLIYPSEQIQQAGVLLGPGGVAVHLYSGRPRSDPGYFGRAELTQNLSAVTAACTTMQRDVFEEAGGFDENLAVAFNDVDLCIRVRDRGYWIVWTPYAELYHHESVSVGRHDSPARRKLFQHEVDTMIERWGRILSEDPFHNPNLCLEPGREFDLAFPPRLAKPWREELAHQAVRQPREGE